MIKLLIFSGIPLNTKVVVGGWIVGFLDSLKLHRDTISVNIAFVSASQRLKTENDNVKLFPIIKNNCIISKIKRYLFPKSDEECILSQMMNVIEECKPDIIHIFGTESAFGLITPRVNIPVIIHLQGLINPYINAWFPQSYSIVDLHSHSEKRAYKVSKYYAKRELRIFQGCNYYMGRTDWDRRISRIYAPDSEYFHCDELLRSEFYGVRYKQKVLNNNVVQLTSVLSSPLYKGTDVILKTAFLLKEKCNFSFNWKVYGIDSIKKAEKKANINAYNHNVELMGRIDVLDLINRLHETDIFIHPSYIDNSPNCVCEAQYIGTPVIACNVGGLSSLIEHKENGILVPANDPYLIASYIKELCEDTLLYSKLSKNARNTALRRHSQKEIIENVIEIYHNIIEKCQKN
jgi:glycosyltransferase involved in cell wall biosynthesis